jgi:hypothetical protein
VHGALSKEEGGTKELPSWYVHILKNSGMKSGYMAIKKAFYRRKPGLLVFAFSFLYLSSFFFGLV